MDSRLSSIKSRPESDDLEAEKNSLIEMMEKQIPEELMRQIEFFSRLVPNPPELNIWTSSNGTGNAYKK
jgi:hypothetical protein